MVVMHPIFHHQLLMDIILLATLQLLPWEEPALTPLILAMERIQVELDSLEGKLTIRSLMVHHLGSRLVTLHIPRLYQAQQALVVEHMAQVILVETQHLPLVLVA